MKKLVTILLYLWLDASIAATVSPWGEATLQVFDVIEQNSDGLDLIVDGDTAYLAAAYRGLYILDISELNNIKVKHHFSLSDFDLSAYSLYSLVKQGNHLFCGFRDSSGPNKEQGALKIVNLSDIDTTGPVIETNDLLFDGNSNHRGKITGIHLAENTNELYAALRLGGLALIDISDPKNPLVKGVFDPGTIEHQEVIVDTVHQRAYFGSWSRGIGSVDISDADPANWTEIRVDDESVNDRYWYLAQRGQYLYTPAADSPTDNTFDEGLAVYDLTDNFADPSMPPARIGFAPIPAQYQCESATGGKDEGLVGGDPGPHQILLKDDYAIVGNGCMGVAIFDITDPENPFFIKAYEIPGQTDWPWSVAISGDHLITVGRNKNYSVNNDIYVFKITPATFAFSTQLNADLNTPVYSESVTINGPDIPTDISISNGKYSINNSPYTDSPDTIINGDVVQLLVNSSFNNNTTTTATLTIGGVSENFNVTTLTDTTPDYFTFRPQDNVLINTEITSNEVSISGLGMPTLISINGGEYSINGGEFTKADGTITNNDVIIVRLLTSDKYFTDTTATITIGGVSASFTGTTISQPSSISTKTGTIDMATIVALLIIRLLNHVFKITKLRIIV